MHAQLLTDAEEQEYMASVDMDKARVVVSEELDDESMYKPDEEASNHGDESGDKGPKPDLVVLDVPPPPAQPRAHKKVTPEDGRDAPPSRGDGSGRATSKKPPKKPVPQAIRISPPQPYHSTRTWSNTLIR